jgi:hypothetical protein
MKRTEWTRRLRLTAALVAVLAYPSVARPESGPQSPEEQLTKAKVDADLGDYDAASFGLTDLVARTDLPMSLRAEALVRLGAVRQLLGDPKGSIEAFARALREHGNDESAVRLLIHGAGGVIPGPEPWRRMWPGVQLGVDVTEPERPSVFVHWPGAPWAPRKLLDPGEAKVVRFVRPAGALYTGNRISLDFKDGDLGDIFRLFADITGLNVVVNPGVHGHVTFRLASLPWDDVLDRMLSALGLAYRLNGPVLQIGRPQDLGPADQRFTGQIIDVDFKDVELSDAFRQVVDAANEAPLRVVPRSPVPGFEPSRSDIRVDVDSKVAGHVTLRLVRIPWDQAFDLIARLNGLRWTRKGNVLAVAPTSTS